MKGLVQYGIQNELSVELSSAFALTIWTEKDGSFRRLRRTVHVKYDQLFMLYDYFFALTFRTLCLSPNRFFCDPILQCLIPSIRHSDSVRSPA